MRVQAQHIRATKKPWFFCCLIRFSRDTTAPEKTNRAKPKTKTSSLVLTELIHMTQPTEPRQVSVICPTFNRPHLHAQLYNVFQHQSYSNKELLVMDDSPTPSPFFTRPAIVQDKRVRYWHVTTRMSIGHKRNYLVQQSRGEYIAHFDDDDYYAPTYLEEMLRALTAADADLVKPSVWLTYRVLDQSYWEWNTEVAGPAAPFVVAGHTLAAPRLDNFHQLSRAQLAEFVENNLWGFGFAYVYRKSLWQTTGLFPDINFGEDFAFVKRARSRKHPVAKCVALPEVKWLVVHMLHPQSGSRVFPQQKIEAASLPKALADAVTECCKTFAGGH